MEEPPTTMPGIPARLRTFVPRPLVHVALRTSVLYWVAAAAYILLSDWTVEALVQDSTVATRVQTFKGWAFVTATALLLYVGLRGQLRRWEREVLERRRVEEVLRTRVAQVQAILAHQPVAFFACDRAGIFTLWEGRTWPEARVPPPGVVGRKVFDLVGEGASAHEAVRRALEGETVAIEHEAAGHSFTIMHTPLNDEHGGRVGTAGVVVEITERKKLEAQLLRAQRLESVGRLAGGVAHDVNNILAPVLLGASLLRHAALDESQRSLLETMEASARRGASIIRQLLVFSRGAEGERGPVLLGPLVTEVRNLIRETFPRNVVIRTAATPDLPHVRGDATQLHQVLLNLCVNARDAMPDGGEIAITLETVELDAASARAWPDATPGGYVVLGIRDTGTGISPEHLDHIFDPFFTTKAVGVGTGLGLSTVLGIVKSHGGFIAVDSQPGSGAHFRVHLPVDESKGQQPAAARPTDFTPGAGECVLVVDDESSVRYLVRQALEFGGYRVLEAATGADGAAQLSSHCDEVRLVITDLMMPALDGRGMLRAIRAASHDVPVLVMTGVGHAEGSEELRQLGVEVQLSKPFTAEALLRSVHRCLAFPRATPASRES